MFPLSQVWHCVLPFIVDFTVLGAFASTCQETNLLCNEIVMIDSHWAIQSCFCTCLCVAKILLHRASAYQLRRRVHLQRRHACKIVPTFEDMVFFLDRPLQTGVWTLQNVCDSCFSIYIRLPNLVTGTDIIIGLGASRNPDALLNAVYAGHG